MKKLSMLYALLFALAFVACKDDDESPSFKKEDFMATWEENDSDNGDGCSSVIRFTATDIEYGSNCDGNVTTSISSEYTFDGKKTITIQGFGESKLVITSLNSTTLKVDQFWEDTKLGSASYTKLP